MSALLTNVAARTPAPSPTRSDAHSESRVRPYREDRFRTAREMAEERPGNPGPGG
jgi:hypothetical protein